MGTLKRLGFLLFSSGLLYAPAWGQSREDAALMSALEAQSYAEVVQRTEHDLRIHPANPWLWTIRGMAFEGEGQTSAGLKCLEKALVINPRYIPALKAAGQIAYRRGDARARGYLDRLLALQPDTPTAHAMEGVLDFSAHRCTDAIAHFERSSALAESDVTSAEEFASCLLEQHRTTEAVNMLTEAYRLHPVKDLRYDLGLAALKDGQASRSLAVLASAPDEDDEMLNLRAAAQIATGNLSDAFASLKRAIELNPDRERNYLDLALLCVDYDQNSLAIEVATAGIGRLPRVAALYTLRGIAYAQSARYDEAQRDFAVATELDPGKPVGTVAQSALSLSSDRPDEAKRLLRAQLKKTPNDLGVNLMLANILIRQQSAPGTADFDELRAAIARAIASNQESAEAYLLKGKMEFQENNLVGALSDYERASRIDPHDKTTLNQMLLILRKLGRKEEAAHVAEKLTSLLSREAEERNGQATRIGTPAGTGESRK